MADPTQPNLRQVHLLAAELFADLRTAGFHLGPADLGENITTQGLDLLGLPRGALLRIGGRVSVGDAVKVELPAGAHLPLERV